MNSRSPGRIIIIGAPRSGTNMLRDALCAFPQVETWPCDEINYIWRHGNVRYPTDEFTPGMARPRVQRYIRKKFDEIAASRNADIVVEKTCANSLRVPFVDRVIPEAHYIYIRRNAVDAVASAMVRWHAKLDLRYIARKARFVPISDLPYYAARYVGNRFHRLLSTEGRLASWGPRFDGMDRALRECSIAEVCALQWRRCVDLAEEALLALPSDRVQRLTYERLVEDPAGELANVASRMGITIPHQTLAAVTGQINGQSVGKGARSLTPETMAQVVKIAGH